MYRLDILSAVGTKRAEITDFLSLSYTRRVNAPGFLAFTLPGEHPAIAELEHNSQVIVYRRNPKVGLDWTADFWGLFRYQQRRFTDHDLFEARCPGIMTMLGWRIVAWYAGTPNRSRFQNMAAETVMKNLVSYNAGSGANMEEGRIRDGAIIGLSVEIDQRRGDRISISCAWDNLLDVLQKIALVGGGDFDLLKIGPRLWEFRFFPGQRGVDRTDDLLFALERGNMMEPKFSHDRIHEATVAVVGGQGEESERLVTVRTGPDYAPDNDIELFVDARNCATDAEQNSRGDARLRDSRARQEFGFKVVQAPGCYYGVHYSLGDLVRAKYGPVETIQKVNVVTISLDPDGREKIDIELTTV